MMAGGGCDLPGPHLPGDCLSVRLPVVFSRPPLFFSCSHIYGWPAAPQGDLGVCSLLIGLAANCPISTQSVLYLQRNRARSVLVTSGGSEAHIGLLLVGSFSYIPSTTMLGVHFQNVVAGYYLLSSPFLFALFYFYCKIVTVIVGGLEKKRQICVFNCSCLPITYLLILSAEFHHVSQHTAERLEHSAV